MATTFDPAKVRQALSEARRELKDAEVRLNTNVVPISFGAAKARVALREAEAAVREMQVLLNANPGRGINFAMIRKICDAEKRVNGARQVLRQHDPSSKE